MKTQEPLGLNFTQGSPMAVSFGIENVETLGVFSCTEGPELLLLLLLLCAPFSELQAGLH